MGGAWCLEVPVKTARRLPKCGINHQQKGESNARLGSGSSSSWEGKDRGEVFQAGAVAPSEGAYAVISILEFRCSHVYSQRRLSLFPQLPRPSLLSQARAPGTRDQPVSPGPLQAQQQAPVCRFNEESPSQEGWGGGFMEALGPEAQPGIQPALPWVPGELQNANSSGKTGERFPRQETGAFNELSEPALVPQSSGRAH